MFFNKLKTGSDQSQVFFFRLVRGTTVLTFSQVKLLNQNGGKKCKKNCQLGPWAFYEGWKKYVYI